MPALRRFQPSHLSRAIRLHRAARPVRHARRNPEESTTLSTFRTGFLIAQVVALPVAMGVSYSRNKSLIWAFLTGFVSLPYLVYVGIEKASEE